MPFISIISSAKLHNESILSSVGRALRSHRRGRRSDSYRMHPGCGVTVTCTIRVRVTPGSNPGTPTKEIKIVFIAQALFYL